MADTFNNLKRLNPAAEKAFQAIQKPGQDDFYQNLITVYLKTSEQFIQGFQNASPKRPLMRNPPNR